MRRRTGQNDSEGKEREGSEGEREGGIIPPTSNSWIRHWVRLQNARFLLLTSNLARERLQIDTDLLHIITSTADKLYGGTNIDALELP